MAFVNYNNREITAKIVYYGPALSGKTTCLRYIYGNEQINNKGKLITLDTDGDRTLFFDFLPLEIGKLGNYSIKIQLYTVPGQVSYDTTRKLVLQGADGVVFVADSQVVSRENNVESMSNLKKNLKLNNIAFKETPLILQFNKRDLKEILPIDILNKDLNPDNQSFFPTIAPTGENVLEGLHAIIKMVIINLKKKLSIFQKDKTVLFSRDEIATDASVTEPKEKIDIPLEETDEEIEVIPLVDEVASEEVFELSSPLGDKEPAAVKPQEEDEEIFQLENPKETADASELTPVPHFDLDDIQSQPISYETQAMKKNDRENFFQTPAPVHSRHSAFSANPFPPPTATAPAASSTAVKTVDIPAIQLEIPYFNDTLKLSLNLTITLKKGKKS